MDTFKKILNLIPDNWQDVLTQSSKFETYIGQAHQFVHTHEETVNAWVGQLLTAIQVDWERVSSWLEQTRFYQELDKVPLDIQAWVATPEDFDWEDDNQRKSLLDEKTELLKKTLEQLSFSKSDGESVDLPLAIDQLREIADVLLNWPEDVNLEDPQAVEQFKTAIMEELRPKLFALIQTLTGLDLQKTHDSKEGHSEKPSFSTRLETLADLPEKVTAAQNTSTAEENTDLPPEVAQALGVMKQVQDAMPVLQAELSQAIPELEPLLSRFGELKNIIPHLKEHSPLVAEAFQNFTSGEDWTNLDVEKLIAELKQLFAVIQNFLATSPITQQLLPLLEQVQKVLPIKLVGFEDGLTFEEKLTQWVNEAIALFTLPEDIDTLLPEQLMAWFNVKLEGLAGWLNHLEVFGATIDNLYQQAKSPIEELLSTEGADLNSAEGVTNFVLDKLKLILDWISPLNEGNPQKDPVTEDNNPAQTEDVGPATEQSTAQPSKGMIPILVNGLRDSIEKGQLIWQFIKENDLGISLEDPDEDAKPPALQPTSYQVSSGAVAAPAEEETTKEAETTSNSSDAQSNSTALDEETTGDENNNTPDPAELISWNQVIMNLIGDRESGAISYLTGGKQDIAMSLKNGEWQQQQEQDLLGFWENSGLATAFEAQYAELRTTLGLEEEPENATPPTLATVLLQVVSGVGLLYETTRVLLGEILRFLVDLLTKLIDVLFEVVKALKVPTELRELLPQPIEEALFGDQDPNVLCLLAAMPTVIIQGLSFIPPDEIRDWVEAT